MTTPVIELFGVTKRFGRVAAVDHVNLCVLPGEIHAIVGENGAGKSTLMKVLSGFYQPDEGEIRVKGRRVELPNPEEAMRHGIGLVHQHFSLVPSLTVAENVVLSDPPRRAGVFLKSMAEKRVRELGEQYGLPVNPRQKLGECRVGMQQRVEILKALYRDPEILILDEPTAVLTPQETDALMQNLRTLCAKGKTIIFVTHKLKEVMALGDRVTVMRAGKTQEVMRVADTSPPQLAALMVGREVFLDVQRERSNAAEELLALENVWCENEASGGWRLKDVSLVLRRGEILGIAGVEGNGQSELVELVAGLRTPKRGRFRLKGVDVTAVLSPAAVRSHGIRHIPENRILQGLALEASLQDNLIMGVHDQPPIGQGLWIVQDEAAGYARKLVRTFDIRPGDIEARVENLSGGNMQKAILARELAGMPQIIVAAHPTRGIDVGAAEFVYDQLTRQRATAGILLVSSDLDEILRLSDRVMVMYQGRIMAEASPQDLSSEELGLLMAGIYPNEVGAGLRASA